MSPSRCERVISGIYLWATTKNSARARRGQCLVEERRSTFRCECLGGRPGGPVDAPQPDLSPIRRNTPGAEQALATEPGAADDALQDYALVRKSEHAPGLLVDDPVDQPLDAVAATAIWQHLHIEP